MASRRDDRGTAGAEPAPRNREREKAALCAETSARSHIVALVVRNWHRSAFTSPEGLHRWIRWARQRENHRPPRDLGGRVDITARTVAGFPVYEVRPAHGREPAAAALSARRRFRLPDHQLSLEPDRRAGRTRRRHRHRADLSDRPRTRFPRDVRHGRWRSTASMLAETAASDIVIVGDSAGGNMAVVMTMMAAQSGLPSPGRHVLISPGLDMSLSNPEVFEAAKRRSMACHSRRAGGGPPLRRGLRPQRLAHQPALRRSLGAAEDAAADRHARHPAPRQPGLRRTGARRGRRCRAFRRAGHDPCLAADRHSRGAPARDRIVAFLIGDADKSARAAARLVARKSSGRKALRCLSATIAGNLSPV